MNFRTFSDLNSTIFSHLQELPKEIDIIAGIPRSGLLAANIIALYLNLPLTDTDSLAEGKVYSTGRTKQKAEWVNDIAEARKILVVDDSCASGKSIREAKEKLNAPGLAEKLIFMAVYVCETSQKIPDIYFENVEFPRMFEWNYLHHPELHAACFDIDGVLCPDPSEEQNDDGEKYLDFIRNAPARFVPTYEIGCIITSRLEKYRAETESWLHKNNIRFKKLIMMQFATKQERIKSASYGKFKAEHYKKMKNAYIFVESNVNHAREIAELSGKLVFCTDNHCTFPESIFAAMHRKIKQRISKFIPRKIKNAIKTLLNA